MKQPAPNAKARALTALALTFLVALTIGTAIGQRDIPLLAMTAGSPQIGGRGRLAHATGLAGRVVSILTDEPLADAQVEAGGVTTQTDSAGYFHLILPPGVYDVHAIVRGYIGMTLLGRPVHSPELIATRAGKRPSLLFEMVPAHPTDAEATLIDQKLLTRRRVEGPRLKSLQPSIDFRTDVETVPRTVRVLMPEDTIVVMDIDQYLRGVVPVEIGPHRPLEALKAQAAAARSYAATRCLPDSAGDPSKCEPDLDANVDTTVRTQVYDPVRRYDTTDQAVLETHGVAPQYAGRLIEAFFFAHSDGRTRNSEDVFASPRPYLRSVADPAPFDFMHGHGVGLSQLGASVLADWGATFDEILRYFYQGVVVSPPQPPVLSAPSASPDVPDSRSAVRFEITYADPEGDPPATADVYVNGRAHPMSLMGNARYAYTTTLQAGSHTYEFHFSDGFTGAVSAAGGVLDVTPATGPAPTSTPPSNETQGGQWRFSSRLDWLDGEVDGLLISEETDASLVLSDDAVAATYTSPVLEADFPFIAVGGNWQAKLPHDAEHGETTLDIRVQASTDGSTWSEWVPLPPGDGGRYQPLDSSSTPSGQGWSELAFVRGHFLRYRVTLTSPDSGTLKPRLDGLTLTYIDAPAGPPSHPATQPPNQPSLLPEPAVIARDEWCNSSCHEPANWPPEYRTPVKFVVHHTVSPNDQDGYQAVRAIYYYHAYTRGWDDIGYNFLIDNQGRIFEGRYGGENDDGETVVGGHALQYNWGSIGVALIGTYSEVEPPGATLDSLVDFLVAKGLQYNIGPYDEGPLAGTEFEYGVLGHREVLPGHTVCPGQAAFDLLPSIRERVEAGISEHRGEPTRTPSVTVSPTATLPAGCDEQIANGGFELDTDGNGNPDAWMLTGEHVHWTSWNPHSGERAIFLGLTNGEDDVESTAEVSQPVSLPANGGQIQLTFQYYTLSSDPDGDVRYVELRDSSGRSIDVVWAPASNGGEWREAVVDLSDYRGLTARLVFGVKNDGDGVEKTYMRIDEVSLLACGETTSTPTPTSVATGTPTVTLTPTSTSTATVTLTPTPVTPTSTPGPTLTPTPPPAEWVCDDLIENASFEDGEAFWTITTTAYSGRITSHRSHSGKHSALVGILDPADDVLSFSSVWQDLVVPADAVSVTFSYWYYPASSDLEDRQIVEVRQPDVELRNRLRGFAGDTSDEQQWLFDSLSLTEHYPGKSVRLYFGAFNRNQDAAPGGVTAMYVDDVSLEVCRLGKIERNEHAYLPLVHR